ncbi:MAG: EpsG family protein [Acutalibacteraceae bacterium]|nr:EpsG family protein [Acutalibacteraceae bacterium]
MLAYWSIFIYTAVISWLCKYVNTNRGYSRTITQKYDVIKHTVGILGSMISCALVIFFAATRGFMADTASYATDFVFLSDDLAHIPIILKSEEKGVLFKAIQVAFKHFISDDYQTWFTCLAWFQGFAVAKFISDYSEEFDFAWFLFVANGTFTWMMNGIRQFTAVAIILLASKYLFNKRWWTFFISVAIAYYIHDTVIIWVIFYFIVQGKPFNKKVIFSILMAVVVVIFLEQFTGLLDSALEGTNHQGATAQFAQDDGANIVTTILFAIPVVIAFWKKDFIESVPHPRHIDVLVNMSCCTMAISLISNFTSGILIGRLPIYFYFGNYVLLPWLIENCFFGSDKNIMKASCYIGYFCYFVYYINSQSYLSSIIEINDIINS